jgi:predicted DNA-binding transcriptional regulator YafY
MYHPTSRVLAVLEMLQSNERMTGAQLAERLEVNVRTLRRYITTLQDLGIQIEADRGRYGCYSLGASFRLPPMMFTNDEALALAIGLLVAAQLGLGEYPDSVESARAKLEQVMPLALKNQVRALNASIQLDVNAADSAISSRIVMIVSSAAYLNRRMAIRYMAEQETQREVDPYSIVYYWGNWYMVGWCHLREAIRSFRLDRIKEAVLNESSFERPGDFDAMKYLEESVANMARRYTFKVLLKIDPLKAQREIGASIGIQEVCDEGVMLHGTSDDLPWIARQLARFPFEFVIHEPEELRGALRDHAASLVRLSEA